MSGRVNSKIYLIIKRGGYNKENVNLKMYVKKKPVIIFYLTRIFKLCNASLNWLSLAKRGAAFPV